MTTATTRKHMFGDPASPGPNAGIFRDKHAYALIMLAALIVYAKSIVYQYTYVDDIFLVVVNHDFLSNLANLPKLFTTDVFISVADPVIFYRPLMNVVFMVEMQLAGNSAVIFHLTNIFLHLASSLLLFVVFRQLRLSPALAFAGALIFCVHPLNSSAVVWIPGRNDTLLTLLVLASFSLFLRFAETRRAVFLAAHVIFFFLALLTKESAFALPVLTLSWLIFISKTKLPRQTTVLLLSSYVVIGGIWYLLRSDVSRTFEVHYSAASVAQQWIGNTPAFLLYFGKILFPFNLSVFPNIHDQSILYGVATLVLFLTAAVVRRPSTSRELLWGFAWYVLFLAPALLSGAIEYEHRAYCSFFGLLYGLGQLPVLQKFDIRKPVHVLVLVAFTALFAFVSMFYSEDYRNRAAFATSAYRTSPSVDESYSSLGGMLLDDGDDAGAEKVLKAGIARNPAMKSVHRMLGNVYARRREYALAANEYETSLRLEPLQLYTYVDYGTLCLAANKPDDAARLWKRSVAINPDFLLGYEYLANYYIYTRHNADSAMIYAREIQRRGVPVLPELLGDIERGLHSENKNHGQNQ